MVFRNIIVTGATQGIGLEFVKQLLHLKPTPKNVIGFHKELFDEFDNLKKQHNNLHKVYFEATDFLKYDSLAEQVKHIVGNNGVDLLINNAGIFNPLKFEETTPEKMIESFKVNTMAPFFLTRSLLPLLKLSAGKNTKTVVVNISSRRSSIHQVTLPLFYPYHTSKVGLNMISKCLSVDLKDDKIIVFSINPGWVVTNMGGPNANIDTATSVNGILKVIENCTQESSGKFFTYTGEEFPW